MHRRSGIVTNAELGTIRICNAPPGNALAENFQLWSGIMFRMRLVRPTRTLLVRTLASGVAALLIACLAPCLIATSGFAAGAEDIGTAQSIISAQEQAFARDDAATAYGFAAPGIQSFYRSPDGFMFMVRNSYAPVYRHRSFVFGEVKVADGKIYQDVQIVDADGAAWDALYTLETQADGSLKISACILKKAVIS
jgi:Domain of unknown function (DUF4864)